MGVNTITVAGIIGLTSRKSLIDIWVDSYLWTYPQYLVGGAIAGCVDVLSQSWGWPALVIGVPPLLLLHRSYLLYLGRIEQQQNHIREMAGLHLQPLKPSRSPVRTRTWPNWRKPSKGWQAPISITRWWMRRV